MRRLPESTEMELEANAAQCWSRKEEKKRKSKVHRRGKLRARKARANHGRSHSRRTG